MHIIEWTDDMALGIPAMDLANQALLLQLAAASRAPDWRFYSEYLELIALLEANFLWEEACMRDIAFPELPQHRRQHQRILDALRQRLTGTIAGELQPGRDFVALLPHWFLIHLATMDLGLAVALDYVGAAARSARHYHAPQDLAARFFNKAQCA